ncbi:MAG: InlB B-repeat-containing protein, partial [Firmicutes bacterium]|nr:InlB B-repeat-containing protein [Candidatus Caballimonas caccae]
MKRIFLTVLSIFMVGLTAIELTACGGSPVSFKLNFVVDSEIVKTIDTNGNENIALPTNPVKDGYTFDGWYWDNGTWQRPFTANSLLNEPLISDMSVYAKFTENNHTHNYSEQVFKPTCTEQGYTLHICDCGDSYKDNYVKAKGHSYSKEWATDNTYHWHVATCEHTTEIKDKANHTASDWIIDENATYEKKGSKHKECTVCKKVLETAEIPQLGKDDISFKTLSVDGTNVYGKIPNNQDEFDFLSEIERSGSTSYKVSLNKSGSEIIESKTAEPIVGDNTYYILVYVNNELDKKYTVTIRRRPIYTVTFNTNGGTTVENQTVEEDSFATEPTTTRTGYTFISWDYDFANAITENKTITASWSANSYALTINYYYNGTTDKIADTYID